MQDTKIIILSSGFSEQYWKDDFYLCEISKGFSVILSGITFTKASTTNNKLKKIVDYEVVAKTIGKLKGNYDGPSNQMEGAALNTLFNRLKSNDLKANKIISNICRLFCKNTTITSIMTINIIKRSFFCELVKV